MSPPVWKIQFAFFFLCQLWWKVHTCTYVPCQLKRACALCSSTTAWDQRESAQKNPSGFCCRSLALHVQILAFVWVWIVISGRGGCWFFCWRNLSCFCENHPFLWSCCCSCSSSSKVCHCAGPACAPLSLSLSLCVSVSDTHRLCCLRLQF
jgi:hypothetical protein